MSESREILNDAEVDFLLSAAASDEAQAPPPEVQPDSQTVTMRGDLDQIQLADIFQTLAMSKMEGVLLVRNPLEERQVYCHNGTVRIKVPPRVALRRLGQRLVHAGLLQPEQLRSTLVLQRKERLPLGQLLVKEGLLEQDQIDAVAGMQVAEDLFSLFTWKHGTFEFYKGELTDPNQRAAFESCPEFEVNSLLLEVARRSDEWEGILAAIGSLDEVPHRIADASNPEELDECVRTLLAAADGHSTYRALAEQTIHSLFEAARAARDLVRGGLLANIDDDRLAQVAMQCAEESQERRAIVLLQTLRDRPGERSPEVVQKMAAALERAGERRLAGVVLLEAAQLQTDPETALAMARRARDLAPLDPGTNSFLRTILLAHSPPDSPELEKCTIDLLDALLEADLTSTVVEIAEDARATGTMRPQILVREARARQKLRDVEGAIHALMELADAHEALGDRPRLVETLESILRLDRARTDIRKRLTLLRQTRLGRIVRAVAIVTCSLLLGGMGIVWWQQSTFEAAVKQADAEVAELLAAGNRAGARERLNHWHEQIGSCEAIEDLRSRIDFAEAAEKTRLERHRRRTITDRINEAAAALDTGDVSRSMSIYRELYAEPSLREQVAEAATARLQAVLDGLEQAAKSIAHGLPPEPSTLIDRRDLDAHRNDLHAICPPALLALYEGLDQAADKLPEFVAAEQRDRVGTLLPQTRSLFAAAAHLTQAYEEALHRNEHERRLDPMFKAAKQREAAFDFAGALELYRQLEQAPAGDAATKQHFRDQVARNATICRLLEELERATTAADFATAQQQLRALTQAYPEVPFDRLVRLPLRLESYPPGASVVCNGAVVGTTPMTLSFVPAAKNELELVLDGFRSAKTTITGDERGAWTGHLVLEPSRSLRFDHPVEQAPVLAGGLSLYVDRGGVIRAVDPATGTTRWQAATGDLSGYLGRPLVRGDQVHVTSLDGELRTIDVRTGKVLWTLPDLPVEAMPTRVDKFLLAITTDQRLHCIDLDDRTQLHAALPEAVQGEVLAGGSTVLCIGERGLVTAHTLPGLTPAWQLRCDGLAAPWAVLAGARLVVADDRGHVHCIDTSTGTLAWSAELDAEVFGPPLAVDGQVLLVTPERIVRRRLADGAEVPPIPQLEVRWSGPALHVGMRLVVPVVNAGLQVLDLASGTPLYRIDRARRGSRVAARDDQLYVMQPDRTVDCFPELR
ncbi:MAG: PQQ-binding-like beta-propeller repeat protein [Planctomycetes bacterium]|nr:PQQ-binding-like beta-propeller repeat protein [Planctomycetota bacterium]